MENKAEQQKSSVRNNIMVSFFLVILVMGISITWILQRTLQDNLSGKGVAKVVVDKIISQYIVTSVGVSIIAISLSLLIAYALSRTITKSISKLILGVEEIGKGNLDYRIQVKNEYEFGILANAFNKMTEDLKKSRAELEKYSKELEKKVKQRTKELQEKIDELEKFNKLTVGRELKMIELKKRIKELENELRKIKKR
jgi:nitrate/nitrite-specific signal transduction histidine kinase